MAFRGIMPAITPERSKYGLLSAAEVVKHTAADSLWVNGFAFETETCNYTASLMPICDPGQNDVVAFESHGPRSYRVSPFGIKVVDECLTVGWDLDDRKARIFRQLESINQKVIEKELWDGTYTGALTPGHLDSGGGSPRWIASEDATVLATGGAVSPKLGLALLEKALGECGSGVQGVIHVPRDVLVLVGGPEAEPDDDDALRMKMTGTKLVGGVGYSGSGPTDNGERTDPLRPWIYATGEVAVHLGAPELLTPTLNDAVNTRTNVTQWVAMQPAAAYWDGCCHFAVQIDLTLGGVDLGGATIDV